MAFKPVKNDITGNVKVSHREKFKLIVNKNETDIWTKIQMHFKHKHTKCVRVQLANGPEPLFIPTFLDDDTGLGAVG